MSEQTKIGGLSKKDWDINYHDEPDETFDTLLKHAFASVAELESELAGQKLMTQANAVVREEYSKVEAERDALKAQLEEMSGGLCFEDTGKLSDMTVSPSHLLHVRNPSPKSSISEFGGDWGATKLYAQRNAEDLGEHYFRHVNAMTAEVLYDKYEIAAELAYRDMQIEKLKAENARLRLPFVMRREPPDKPGLWLFEDMDGGVHCVTCFGAKGAFASLSPYVTPSTTKSFDGLWGSAPFPETGKGEGNG